MPNGISCAYFAARNHIYGKKEDNPFKKGIAGVQAVRTVDSVAKTGVLKGSVATSINSIFNTAASFGRKIVYPLIIGSGVYNTVKSDDKVRTGSSQALGISTMYVFEQVTENLLNKMSSLFNNNSRFTNNKFLKGLWYFVKGMTFVGASLSGYNVGSKAAETFVDEYRASKSSSHNKEKIPTAVNATTINDDKKTIFPIEEGLNESQIFSEMDL
ncbi:MAG: hypothetical protein IJY61_05150 [Candidatus Gastranaerophilales bacterium]|nr:hypothetical protein [Candidatus Gastranaerophilales bacterium]